MSIPDNITFGARPREEGRFSRACGDGDIPTALDRGIEVIPRDQLPDKGGIPRRHVKHIFAQLDGHCSSNGIVGNMMTRRSQQGLSHVVLAPECLYYRVGGWGTGSTLPDNIQEAMERGVRTRAQVPKPSGRGGVSYRDEWATEAVQNRLLEAVDLGGDFDSVLTCLNLDWPCLIGLTWPGRRGGGHCVACTEFTKGRRERDDTLAGPNSWGADWNGDGFYGLTRGQCADMAYYGAFAIRVVSEADDDEGPPELK